MPHNSSEYSFIAGDISWPRYQLATTQQKFIFYLNFQRACLDLFREKNEHHYKKVKLNKNTFSKKMLFQLRMLATLSFKNLVQQNNNNVNDTETVLRAVLDSYKKSKQKIIIITRVEKWNTCLPF